MIIKILALCAIALGINYLFNVDYLTGGGVFEAIALIIAGVLGLTENWNNHRS